MLKHMISCVSRVLSALLYEILNIFNQTLALGIKKNEPYADLRRRHRVLHTNIFFGRSFSLTVFLKFIIPLNVQIFLISPSVLSFLQSSIIDLKHGHKFSKIYTPGYSVVQFLYIFDFGDIDDSFPIQEAYNNISCFLTLDYDA